MVFFTLEQSFLSFELQKTLHKVIFTKFLKLDPDPLKKPLDLDPQKMNADPQPSLQEFKKKVNQKKVPDCMISH